MRTRVSVYVCPGVLSIKTYQEIPASLVGILLQLMLHVACALARRGETRSRQVGVGEDGRVGAGRGGA